MFCRWVVRALLLRAIHGQSPTSSPAFRSSHQVLETQDELSRYTRDHDNKKEKTEKTLELLHTNREGTAVASRVSVGFECSRLFRQSQSNTHHARANTHLCHLIPRHFLGPFHPMLLLLLGLELHPKRIVHCTAISVARRVACRVARHPRRHGRAS